MEEREKDFKLNWSSFAETEWNSSQGWLKGNISQPGSECVSAAAHKYTRTRTHTHMRIHPPDLADLFPSSGRWGIFFLVMCCFLASVRLYSLFVEGAPMGKCLHHLQPHLSHLGWFFSSLFFLTFFLSSWIFFLPLCCSLYLLPSLSWHLLSGSLIILFFRLLIIILLFFFPLSVFVPHPLSLSSSVLPTGPPSQTFQSNNISFLALSLTFSALCHIKFSIIQSTSPTIPSSIIPFSFQFVSVSLCVFKGQFSFIYLFFLSLLLLLSFFFGAIKFSLWGVCKHCIVSGF